MRRIGWGLAGWWGAALLAAAPWFGLQGLPAAEDLAAISGGLPLTEARAARIVALGLARLAAIGLAPALVGAGLAWTALTLGDRRARRRPGAPRAG